MAGIRSVFGILLLVLVLGLPAHATHIVGGDFYYRQIGTNRYVITMKLYIDCENGMPGAIGSDQVAIIALWDAKSSNLIRTETFTRTSPKRLNKLHYKCLIPPQDICVDQYTYTKTLTIDPGSDGVILSFQRCCRNNTISNLVAPESTGATYWVKIPGSNTTKTNNSAVFKELPPNYICTDAPLQFDHSAVDPDGDSLVYELYQPFLGATKDLPRPDNSTNGGFFKRPPFNNVIWKNPYSTANQISGDPKMEIDRFTGELTLTPNKVGQYVLGIKVKEYRNGVLVGETYRDYQMNVRECNFYVVSAFGTAKYSCSDTVEFTNKSLKAEHYLWDFGDPTRTDDTSTDLNPTYVYPGDGVYTVTLKAWTEICEDEYSFEVHVIKNIDVDLGPDIYFCDKNDVDALLTPRKFDATKVEWNNGQFGHTIRARKEGTYIASVYYGQCVGHDTLDIKLDPVEFSIPEDSIFCEIEDVDMIADVGISGLKYRWSPSPYDTFQTYRILDTGSYWVRVRNEHCQKVDSIRVYLSTKPEIGSYLFVCNEFEKTLDAGDIPDAEYLWSDGSTDRYNLINSEGLYWVQVTQKVCVARDTLIVDNPVINLELGDDTHYCDSVYRYMSAPPGMRSYLWHDGSTGTSFETRQPGKYYVMVEDTNGCIKSDTVFLSMTLSPDIDLGGDTSICMRSSATLGIANPNYAFQWNTGEKTQYIEAKDSGYYILKITDESGCSAWDTIHVSIDINALPNELFIANAFTPNNDGLNELFPFAEDITQPEYRVRIFNRWGQKVFDSELDQTQQWDAYFQGERVKPDAYVYMIEYRGCDGRNRTTSGTVTVME